MKGSIFLRGIRSIHIHSSNFTKNDPGPIFSTQQIVGMLPSTYFDNDQQHYINRASGIYISDKIIDITI